MAKARSKSATPPPAETPDQPYYLQKARIKDYRSVRDAEVKFKPGLNIIIGPNGSGKTNFLRAVEGGLKAAPDEDTPKVASFFTIDGERPFTISYEERAAKTTDDVFTSEQNYLPLEVFVNGKSVPEYITLRSALRSHGIAEQPRIRLIQHNRPKSALPFLELPLDLRISRSPSALSRHSAFGLVFEFILSEAARAILNNLNAGQPFEEKELLAWINSKTAPLLTLLNECLPKYSPVTGIRVSPVTRLYWNESQQELLLKGMVAEYLLEAQWYDFDALSDGTKRLIYLISDLVTPAAVSISMGEANVSFKDVPRIILLEEPELGIHPHQLHLLLGLIRSVARKHQVIITTHSPQVLDMLEVDELDRIIICELKDPKKGTQFKRLTKAKIAKAKRYMKEVGHLSDFWMHSDMEDPD